MRSTEVVKDIYWVGAVDWNCRDFHGYSLSPMGTTYNNYLIMDEKVTLVDTVKSDFSGQMFCNIANVLGDRKVDYIVVNHVEPDHAGALPEAIERLKPEKIFCSPMAERAMKAHFHYKDWPVEVVKTGDSLSIGKHTLKFVETRMLHWPDSMITYVPEAKLMFSNDAFGQNLATSERFADEVDRSMLTRLMLDYYANIVLPFSSVVLKTLDALGEMNLDVEYICPDHGLIFRGDDVRYAMDLYREFAEQKPKKKAVILFDTMWHSTEKMAEAIASGIAETGVSVRIMALKANHHSQVMSEVFDSSAVVVGSPTHNNGILPMVSGMLTYMKGLKPQNKLGAAFGSFGWSGECVKAITERLEGMHMEMVEPSVKTKFVPDHDEFGKCYELGKAIGEAVIAKVYG